MFNLSQAGRQVKVTHVPRVTTAPLAPPYPSVVGQEPSAMSLVLTCVSPARLDSTVWKVCHILF